MVGGGAHKTMFSTLFLNFLRFSILFHCFFVFFSFLGLSWSPLGALWGDLGPSWDHLGAPLGDLGTFLGASWSHIQWFYTPTWSPRASMRGLGVDLWWCWDPWGIVFQGFFGSDRNNENRAPARARARFWGLGALAKPCFSDIFFETQWNASRMIKATSVARLKKIESLTFSGWMVWPFFFRFQKYWANKFLYWLRLSWFQQWLNKVLNNKFLLRSLDILLQKIPSFWDHRKQAI